MGHDFWRAQLDSYIGWSGRYTATLLITWFGKFYLQQYWLVPWLTLSLLFSSFVFIYWTVFSNLRRKKYFILFPISFFALFLSSSIAGHGVGVINEGLFWLSGAVTYQIGAVFYFLFTACFVWMARSRYKVMNLFFSSLFLSLGMGSNETLMLLSCGTIIVLFWLYRKSFQMSFLVVAGVALFCCFVVIFAPGNNVRLATAEGHDFLSALTICLEKVVQVYFYCLINPLLWLFVIFFHNEIDSSLSHIEQLVPLRYFYFLLVALIYCLYFPVAWSLNSGAPDRLVSFIGFVGLFCSIFIVRALLQKVSHFVSFKGITVLCLVLMVIFFPFIFKPLYVAMETIPKGARFYASHVARNVYVQKMAKEGALSVAVKPIEHNRLLLFRDLDASDHSKHYATYYGVDSISVAD